MRFFVFFLCDFGCCILWLFSVKLPFVVCCYCFCVTIEFIVSFGNTTRLIPNSCFPMKILVLKRAIYKFDILVAATKLSIYLVNCHGLDCLVPKVSLLPFLAGLQERKEERPWERGCGRDRFKRFQSLS